MPHRITSTLDVSPTVSLVFVANYRRLTASADAEGEAHGETFSAEDVFVVHGTGALIPAL